MMQQTPYPKRPEPGWWRLPLGNFLIEVEEQKILQRDAQIAIAQPIYAFLHAPQKVFRPFDTGITFRYEKCPLENVKLYTGQHITHNLVVQSNP